MSLAIRPMTADDIELGMRLKTQAGWNQTPADWERFLFLEPEGCFVAEWDGEPVATTTTCTFDSVGWIGMVLVDESFRHRGIATGLVSHALEYLDGRSIVTVRLDATEYGRPVYERIGFVPEHDFVRLQGIAPSLDNVPEMTAVCAEHIDDLASLDHGATGTNRRRLLERLIAENPATSRLAMRQDSIDGYVLLRPGANATQIGPAAARTEKTGELMADWALGHCAGRPVFTDVPLGNHAAIEWAQRRGLAEQRRFTRMVRGLPVREDVALLWASSGPEKG